MTRHDYDLDGHPEVSTTFTWIWTVIVFAAGIGAGLLLRGWL